MKAIYKPGDLLFWTPGLHHHNKIYTLRLNEEEERVFIDGTKPLYINISVNSSDTSYILVTDIFREPSLTDNLYHKISLLHSSVRTLWNKSGK